MTLTQLKKLNKKNGGFFFENSLPEETHRISEELGGVITLIRTYKGKDTTFHFSSFNGRIVNSGGVR